MIKIQVPIDKEVRDKLERRAKTLGFDSLQAYIRFWAKAEVDGRMVDFGDGDLLLTSPILASRASANNIGRG